MTLHLPTILFLTALVAALIGLLQLAVWLQRPRTPALLWWAGAHLIGGLGALAMAFRADLPASLLVLFANTLILLGFSAIWTGARVFGGRKTLWPSLIAGPVLWLYACAIPSFYENFPIRVALFSFLAGAITLAAGQELDRPLNRPLMSSRLAAGILYAHGLLLLLRVPFAFLLDYSSDFSQAPLWFAVVGIEPVLFIIAIGLCLIALVKERVELTVRQAAGSAPLTGIANRRAFLEQAENLAATVRKTASSGAMLVFDLDHFKRINDTYGHGAGDQVLILFSGILRRNLRRTDAVGRIGGEEFAAFLPGADKNSARRNADRIRNLFREAALAPGLPTPASVSIGVAVAAGTAVDVASLIECADRALYRAKLAGRDQVVLDSDPPPREIDAAGAPCVPPQATPLPPLPG